MLVTCFMRFGHPIRLLFLATVCLFVKPYSLAEIAIDGVLDEPEWAEAMQFKNFVSVVPLTGSPAKYATTVRVLASEDGIFFGFENHQPAEVKRIRRQFARDANVDADRNIVSIDFEGNALVGYCFVVGSANSRQDATQTNSEYSNAWDGTWYSQTHEDGEYWYSEIHIPWTVAPMSKAADGRKKISLWFSRVVYDESLRFAFPDAFYSRPTFLEDWHTIELDYKDQPTLDLFPYISYTEQIRESGDSAGKNRFEIGFDVIWRPNGSTQVTGAINPDFGQVESDDLVVNFTAFETFVSEKRPFFTENQSLFSSSIPNDDQILYTRRIGAGNSDGLMDIDVALKTTHFGDNIDLGLFAVLESDQGDRFGGEFFASRFQRKVNDLTLGHRLTYSDKPILERQAIVQAIDLDWQNQTGLRIKGELLFSDVRRGSDAAGSRLEIEEQDFAGWTKLSYGPSDAWKHNLFLSRYGDEFDLNDLGFMKRNDITEVYGSSRYKRLKYDSDSILLSSSTKLDFGYSENSAGLRLESWLGFENEWDFRSTRSIEFNFGVYSSGWDDRITRGNGIAAYSLGYWSYAEYQSPQGDQFNYFAALEADYNPEQELSWQLSFGPEVYATDNLTLSTFFSFGRKEHWLIWDSDTHQLAGYDSAFFNMNLGLDWYPSERHEVRIKFQWVGIDAEVVSGYMLDDKGRLIISDSPSLNFSLSDTALQLRYRFQIAPLSDIFLVYSRGGYYASQSGEEGPGKLLREGWEDAMVETFIAKIRYRF